jgi:50S ribosomal protein L16 3-hydroxylase
MPILDRPGQASFLARHWQKSPLFMPGTFEPLEPELSPDELAWLSTMPDVESRLVFTERQNDEVSYRVEHGPFDDATLTGLPDADWTLLVQDVDKHLPDFRVFLQRVAFIPDWRIDDLMVSVAAPGGSVGPHRDNYDVFLVQGSGQREWRLAEASGVCLDERSSELSLLQPFAGNPMHLAHRTDVLYLPPGVPHWGIAVDRCMTYSIGMRAPQRSEFESAAARLFPRRRNASVADGRAQDFYEDPDLSPDEATPGLIHGRTLQRARSTFDADRRFNDGELATIFGSLVTDPKAWLAPERPGKAAMRKMLQEIHDWDELSVHGMTRMAFTGPDIDDGQAIRVFVNGFWRCCPAAALENFATLCAKRRLNDAELREWQAEAELHGIFEWLLASGAFDPGIE